MVAISSSPKHADVCLRQNMRRLLIRMSEKRNNNSPTKDVNKHIM